MTSTKHIRVLFFSDTHLGFDYPQNPRVERRHRGVDFFNNFQRVLIYATTQKVDVVIHGGDLFFRARIPQFIVDKVYSLLLEFAKSGILLFIVPGNHEYSRFPGLYRLTRPNIHVFTKPRTFLQTVKGVAVSLSGFPYERRNIRSRFGKCLAECRAEAETAQIRLLCLHHAIEGARVKNYTFRSGQDVILSRDIPGRFHAILSGHIHRRQILTFKSDDGAGVPVIYSGSIERTSAAEKDEEKGFYLLDFTPDSNNYWKIANLAFNKLPVRPMLDLMIDMSALTPNTLRPFLRQKLLSLDSNAIVRLTCTTPPVGELAGVLTARLLREVAPKTMNVSLSAKFFKHVQYDKSSRKHTRRGQIRLELF